MRKDNIFVVGGQVSGASFFGRSAEIESLAGQLRGGGRGRAIVGLNRIGKSSLINKLMMQECVGRDNILYLKESVYVSGNDRDFWKSFTKHLREEVRRLQIQDQDIENALVEILGAEPVHNEPTPEHVRRRGFGSVLLRLLGLERVQEAPPAPAPVVSQPQEDDPCAEFNTRVGDNIKKIMKRLGVLGYRVVIVLDEFDDARRLFKQRPGSLSLIRDLGTDADMKKVAVFTLSRRTLDIIEDGIAEAHVSSTSTLCGAFHPKRIKGFSEADMMQFWDALADYDIFPDEQFKARILHYAGHHPYMLSLFGNQLAERALLEEEISLDTIDQIYNSEWMDVIKKHYKTMLDRMKEDGHARELRGILCGPINGITEETVESFKSGGYLEQDSEGFYTISRDFTKHFVRNTTDITSPIWDVIMEAERTLKQFMIQEYPKLETLHYSDVKGQTGWAAELQKKDYPTLRLNENIVEGNMKRTHKMYDSNPTIIESLMLSYVVDHILAEWTEFRKYFRNEPASEWKRDMELVAKARNALAHACPEYLKQYETDMLPACCNKINALNPKRV